MMFLFVIGRAIFFNSIFGFVFVMLFFAYILSSLLVVVCTYNSMRSLGCNMVNFLEKKIGDSRVRSAGFRIEKGVELLEADHS